MRAVGIHPRPWVAVKIRGRTLHPMSLRSDRPRRPRNDIVSAQMWTAVYRYSALHSLVGVCAGGWLLLRSISISAVDGWGFGPDIPLAAVLVCLWAAGVFVLVNPPTSVVADVGVGRRPVGVLSTLGRRFRFWNVISAPISGLLLVFLAWPLIQALTEPKPAPWMPSLIAPYGVGFVVVATFAARIGRWGAELTPDVLMTHGFFLDRRYARDDIRAVTSARVTGVHEWLLGMLMNRPAVEFFALRVHLLSGKTKVLFASHSTEYDIQKAARIVNARLAPEVGISPDPSTAGNIDPPSSTA